MTLFTVAPSLNVIDARAWSAASALHAERLEGFLAGIAFGAGLMLACLLVLQFARITAKRRAIRQRLKALEV